MNRTLANDLPVNAVEIRNLVKIYDSGHGPPKAALKGLNLGIPRGSIFGLLGPNGAGKSTLINILAGLVIKTAGEAKVWDYDVAQQPRAARSCIGVVPQELNLDAFFTPRELLDSQAGLYGVPKRERRTDALLDAVDLTEKADAFARTLSGGMRRRLMVAKAMVHNPPVLVLDEPTAGVDVELRLILWEHIRQLNAAGTTVLLTTHYLEEAEQLCDRIAIIHEGRLVVNDTTPNLLQLIDSKRIMVTLESEGDTSILRGQGWEQSGPRQWNLVYQPSKAPIGRMLAILQENGLKIADVSTEETDLEDIFMQLIQSRS